MKKTLVASILGVVASAAIVASAQAQGFIKFDTYNAASYNPIKYTLDTAALTAGGLSPALAGTTVGSGFQAAVYYALGTGFSSLSQLTLVPGAVATVGTIVPGYVTSGAITIPGYTSGAVTFAVVAWSGGASFDASNLKGSSALFVEPGLATGALPVNGFTVGVPQIYVTPVTAVPEPTTLALAGLSGAALLIFRRRK